MYKLPYTINGEIIQGCILRTIDNTIIPFDPDNIDYQEYLKWLAEGNEPAPPDQSE
jgi:hypothetical protein